MENEKRLYTAKKFFHSIQIGIFIICSSLLFTGCVVQKLNVNRLSKKAFRSNEVFNLAHSGLLIYDPESKKNIFNINGYKSFTPASNTKLFTFYTAKRILGDSIPSIEWCIRQDTLYFTGLGDPTFLHPDFEIQPSFDLLQSTPNQLVYIPNSFDENRFGPGWSWDDFAYYYSVEKSSLPIYGNRVWITKRPADSTFSIIPSVFEDQIVVNNDTTLPEGKIKLDREEFHNLFYITYHAPEDSIEEVIPFNYSDELSTYLLSDTLGRNVVMMDTLPVCDLKVTKSQSLDTVLQLFMLRSDNFFGEQLLLQCAWTLSDTLSTQTAINRSLTSYFYSFKDEIRWVDGSGLSRYNQFTPHSMVLLLEMIQEDYSRDYIKAMFPAGGVSGTLRNYFQAEEPYIFAKTGSLSNVYNLSGYLITKSGKWLIFSFMNNNVRAASNDLKKEMEEILWRFRENY